MAGRHALGSALRVRRAAGPPGRRTRFVLVGLLVATLALVGAAVAGWPGAGSPDPAGSVAGPTAGPTGPQAAPERDAQRPSRGGSRLADRPRASPSPRTSESQPAEPAEPAAPAVPEGGEVVSTGSCGASFYYEPQPTASGEVFDPEAMTAAHKTWDFDTRARVTNPATGQSVVVRINDRGPYIDGRCLDLSRGAFREVAPLDAGVITVTYEVLSD